MAFYTIYVEPGLTPAERRRARRAGPRAVDCRRDHDSLLRSAGFEDVIEQDVTTAFLTTARDWLRETDEHEAELAPLESDDAFAERQQERRTMITAIEDGLLGRSLFVASKRER